jgi:polyhydroxybutyrate depolymerase
MSDGLSRSYLLYVPPGDSKQHRLPLVLVYHGAYDTASDTTTENDLLAVAQQQHNMILAFPQGYQDSWNDDDGDPPAEAAKVNDVAFTATILQGIESSYHVDMTRVVATGISNGALLVELLGCRLAANLTLIAPVEGQLAPTFSSSCRPAMPISVYEVHATADPAIPYDGGTIGGDGGPFSVLSAPASAKRWATLDHCAAKGSRSTSGDSVFTKYRRCGESVTVTLNSIQGGAHVWPPRFGQTLVRAITSLPSTREATKP